MMKTGKARSEVLAFLGMARRAGNVVVGTDAVRQALRKGDVKLLILASDGSETQKKKLVPLAEARGVRWETLASSQELGAAVGAGSLTAVGVIGNEFAGELKKRLGGD